jgi:NAD(P)-dependent dehydrogenase (short-subunit alcohol dehydrogenase family)
MPTDLFSVRDQTVLVSGGSRGIGAAIARGFAERGARVVITGREAATLAETSRAIGDGVAHPVAARVCDVADAASIRQLAEWAAAELPPVDTLVNVAGVNRRQWAEEFSEADWDFVLDINLKGAFLLSQAIGRQMLARRRGNQINIVSLNTDRPLVAVLPYAASKAALAHITRSLALEWGDRGVRVNAIAPGFILTDLTRKLWSDPDVHAWGMAHTPQRRLGEPEDMVGTAIFLASEASAFMTGQILYVDGGFTAGWNWPIPLPPPSV